MYRNLIQLVLLVAIAFSFVSSQLFCSDLLKRNRTRFHPVRHCQRSNQTRIAAKNVANLEKCIQFTENNQGLAFNFGHGKRPRKKSNQNDLLNLFDVQRDKEIKERVKNETKMVKLDPDLKEPIEPYFNCEVLSCPEIGNMSSMINDTRYDYYTLYGNGMIQCFFGHSKLFNSSPNFCSAPGNATCFPTVGLFVYYYVERMNYTNAINTCTGHRGLLANIMSDERTNFLSFQIQHRIADLSKSTIITADSNQTTPSNKIPIRHAFIGLSEIRSKGNFVDSFDIPIKCYRYRAWAPNYPM